MSNPAKPKKSVRACFVLDESARAVHMQELTEIAHRVEWDNPAHDLIIDTHCSPARVRALANDNLYIVQYSICTTA